MFSTYKDTVTYLVSNFGSDLCATKVDRVARAAFTIGFMGRQIIEYERLAHHFNIDVAQVKKDVDDLKKSLGKTSKSFLPEREQQLDLKNQYALDFLENLKDPDFKQKYTITLKGKECLDYSTIVLEIYTEVDRAISRNQISDVTTVKLTKVQEVVKLIKTLTLEEVREVLEHLESQEPKEAEPQEVD